MTHEVVTWKYTAPITETICDISCYLDLWMLRSSIMARILRLSFVKYGNIVHWPFWFNGKTKPKVTTATGNLYIGFEFSSAFNNSCYKRKTEEVQCKMRPSVEGLTVTREKFMDVVFYSPFWLLRLFRRSSLWTASLWDGDDIRVLALPRKHTYNSKGPSSTCNGKLRK